MSGVTGSTLVSLRNSRDLQAEYCHRFFSNRAVSFPQFLLKRKVIYMSEKKNKLTVIDGETLMDTRL